MDNVSRKPGSASRTRSIAFVGLSIALMAVSAWVSIPLGPVPFTLQTFMMVFALLVLKPRECMAAIAGYLVLGAIGLPVFSSMRGGIGILAGPTGGFLWGYLLGAALTLLLLQVVRPSQEGEGRGHVKGRGFALDLGAALLFLVVVYVCGWLQFMAVTGVDSLVAFMTAVAPFLLVEVVKLAAAIATARAVRRVVR